jgi:hypothetical protein
LTGATSYFSNAGNLSNTGNLVMATAESFFSNAGTFSNTNRATFLAQVGISNAPASGWALDVNGPSRAAIMVMQCNYVTGYTLTLSQANFGTYFVLTGTTSNTAPLTIAAPGSNTATSNLGKFWTVRNNTGSDLTTSFTGTSAVLPVGTTLFSNTSLTVVLSQVTPIYTYTQF